MEYKILVIANEVAGKGMADDLIPEVIENLQELGYVVEKRITSLEENATAIIKKYEGHFDILIVCGGDGTLNEVVQGLYDKNIHTFIGYIPTGTTNDFANSLGLKRNNIDISWNINKYVSQKIDLGLFNDRVFNYVASFGLFTKCSYATSIKMKNTLGRKAYVLTGIKELFTNRRKHLKVLMDSLEIEDDFIYGSISNSKCIGGFKLFKKQDIKLNDGKFEVLLVRRPRFLISLLFTAIKLVFGNLNDKNIYCYKADKVSFECEEEMDWSIDGECNSGVKNATIKNLNKYIEYILPDVENELTKEPKIKNENDEMFYKMYREDENAEKDDSKNQEE